MNPGLRTSESSVDNGGMTFTSRVEAFWEWFPARAKHFFDTIEAGQCAELAEEVSQFMDRTLPHLAWVFGPGENGGHSFTVSGEGVIAKQLLAARWLEDAMDLPGWTFYGSRQPCDDERLGSIAIGLAGDRQIDANGFQVATIANEEQQKFDIVAWHPLLEELSEDDRMTILYLLLDEALGEFGTEQWLGTIDLHPLDEIPPTDPPPRIISLSNLREFIGTAQQYHGWEKHSPLHVYSFYQFEEQSDGPRGDSLGGTTLVPNVVIDFITNDGNPDERELDGTGAELVYLRFDTRNLPQGQEIDARANIEDAIDEALEPEGGGRTLGGAIGLQQSYIDIVIFDGDRSRELILAAVEKLQLRGETALEVF